MRRALLPTLLLLIGCAGSGPVPTEGGPRSGTVNVVVWSVHAQRAVPAEGTLTFRVDGTRREFTTRANPAEGASVGNLPPGPYRISILRRFDPAGRAQRVEGTEDVYLEPGARVELTIVVSDREGELGWLPDPSSPAVSSSHLPLTTPRSVGPS